jgi:hypothetical protein
MSMKNSNYIIRNQTRYLPTCSAAPQPTVPPRAPMKDSVNIHNKSNHTKNIRPNSEIIFLMFQLHLEQIATEILTVPARFCNLCCEAVCNGTVYSPLTMLQMKFPNVQVNIENDTSHQTIPE